jgi:hypothetical protein
VIRRCIFCLTLVFSFVHETSAQRFFLGFRTIISAGSHEQRVGIGLHVAFQFSRGILSVGNDGSFYLSSWGGRTKMWESRTYFGAAWYADNQKGIGDFELGTLKNPFSRSSTFGYAYIWYWDNALTQQTSGAFRGEHQGHSVFFENDFFAGQGKDRFRTATLRYRYRWDFWSAHTGIAIWTGETSGVQVETEVINGKTTYFKDLSSLTLGNTSHGIIYGGIRYGPGRQCIGLDVGMDSERLRHAFQNQMAHHRIWHPKKPEKAVKYPMLDPFGKPTWESRNVRRALPYFRLSISED